MSTGKPFPDRTLWPAVIALAAVFLLFEFTPLDLAVQDHFYDFVSKTWCVDADEPAARTLFYTGPKVLIICVGVAVLVLAAGPKIWRERLGFRRIDLWIALAVLASTPALISAGKATTNIFCPYQITRYGGRVPYVRVLEKYPVESRPQKHGRGFPAGHASGGFALFGLAGLASTRRGRAAAIITALAAGWAMGGYQILRGAHYLSHTLVTMLVCWTVFLLWRRLASCATTSVEAKML